MIRFRSLLRPTPITRSAIQPVSGPMMWLVICSGCLGAVAASPQTIGEAAPVSASTAQLPLPPEQVVTHVSRTITWYRRIVALQQLAIDSDDVVPRDRLYQSARIAVQLAFELGRAAAVLADKPATTPTGRPEDSQNSQVEAGSPVDRAAARMAARIADLQSLLSSIDQQTAHATPQEKAALDARRGEVLAALDLARQIQGTIGQIERFEDLSDPHAAGTSGGLAAQLADLRRSVPEIRVTGTVRAEAGASSAGTTAAVANGSTAPASPTAAASPAPPPAAVASAPIAPPATAASNAETFRPESAGVIALLGKWFSLEGARRQLADAAKQTDGLAKELESVRGKATQDARALASQDLPDASTDPAQLLQSKQKLEAAVARFKQLSTLLIPLGEQAITLQNAHNILDEWRDSISGRIASVARYLALRLGVLLGSVAAVLVVSEVWRRATFRYLHDARRRQQFLALRRVAVGVALTIVVVFGLVSEVGSLATYAGLITAGLAVALQNVILAVVAYFFLIGRYGVRVGDRITLAGVTGRVVEIGLVRIYLMELTGPQLRSSGRMVVLSNAVVFQPTALFKQMPGGDFLWHTITLTLDATTDVEAAEKRLREAAESVYEKYRPAIEQQHAALQRFIDFQTAMPQPEVYARLNAKGLECTVRYPAEPVQAASTDQKMLLAVRAALSTQPPLQLVDGPLLDTEG